MRIESKTLFFVVSGLNLFAILLSYVLQISFLSVLWAVWIQLFALVIFSAATIKQMAKIVKLNENDKKEINHSVKILFLIFTASILIPIAIVLYFFNYLFWSVNSATFWLLSGPNAGHIVILALIFLLEAAIMQLAYWQRLQIRVQPNMNPRKEVGRIVKYPINQSTKMYGGIFATAMLIFMLSPIWPQIQNTYSIIFCTYLLTYDTGEYLQKLKKQQIKAKSKMA